MNRTMKILVGLATVLALLVIILVGTAWAQTRGSQTVSLQRGQIADLEEEDSLGSCHTDATHHEVVWQSLANSLGMTPDELKAQVKQGATLSDIASKKKLTAAQLEAAIKAAVNEMLNQHVRSGEWKQADADAVLEEMMDHMTPSHLLDMLTESAHAGIDMGSMHGDDMDGMHGENPGGMMDEGSEDGCHGDSSNAAGSSNL